MFPNISNFALKFLSIPFSNAVVERVFSVLNLVKCKIRNKMKIDTLDSILRIRIHFSNEKVCCQSFMPTDKMLQLFTYDIQYVPELSLQEEKKLIFDFT
jgi:hypothetical protein